MKRRWLGAVIALTLMLAALAAGVARTEWFRRKVHARIVSEIEKSTGGRVEMRRFDFDWTAMRASLEGLVVRGTEGEGEDPLFSAARVTLEMRILSWWRRQVDLRALHVESPRIHYTGSNLPQPPAARVPGKDPFATLVDLAVAAYAVKQGEVRFRDDRYPLELEGKDLNLRLVFDRASRAYEGEFQAAALTLARPFPLRQAPAVGGRVRFERDRIAFSAVRLRTGSSSVEGRGEWRNGEARLDVDCALSLAEWTGLFPLAGSAGRISGPWEKALSSASATFKGAVRFRAGDDWEMDGTFTGSRISYEGVRDIELGGPVRAGPDGARFSTLSIKALGGRFDGKAAVNSWSAFEASGEIRGFSVSRLAAAARRPAPGWDATIEGAVRVEGPDIAGAAQLRISTVTGSAVRGEVNARFRQRTGELSFDPSFLELPGSRLNFSGTLDRQIEAGVISTNLDDFLPLLGIESLPVRLEAGQLRFDGAVSGNISSPAIRGTVRMGPFAVADQRVRELEATIEATPSRVTASALRVSQNGLAVRGSASAVLTDWRLPGTNLVSAKLTMDSTNASHLLSLASSTLPVEGMVSAAFEVSGTLDAPRVSGAVRMPSVRAWEEAFSQVEAAFEYTGSGFRIQNGRARKAGQPVEFSGSVDNNDVRFEVNTRGTRLRDWSRIAGLQPNLDGRLNLAGRIAGRRTRTQIQVSSLDGGVSVEDLTVSGLRVGALQATARTQGRVTLLTMTGQVRDSVLRGSAEWSVATGSGLGQISATNLTFAALRDVGLFGDPSTELPIRGVVDAEIGFSGPILRPDLWTGLAKVTRLEIEPARSVPGRTNGARFLLRNSEALLVQLDSRGANLQAVRLVAEGADIEATGTVAYRSRNPWNLRLRGRVNLPLLSAFEPDLLAAGVSQIDATIRGSLARPNLTGRMEIRDASLGLRNVPNGLDKVTGAIVFDRTRANIEKITAQTGGGELALSGFVDFGGAEWLYTVLGQAQRVRVRYPESTSSTLSGAVILSGTSARSLLSGRVVIQRVAIDPRTDIGGLLAAAGRGGQVPGAPPNDFLRNMQLDLKVVTAPDAELHSSVARDVVPEVNLEVRGSAVRPVLLGRVSVNQGEIQFFGNQYTIARADISFYNPVRIEPVMDMDLETKIRGVTVNINFTGPVNKLDVSYRSDPPLQSAEIVALLAVGRTPGSGITPNLPTQNQAFLQPGNNTLLGQAVTAPINDRLTRLFGVSRIKIDPELTGVTNTPQARLTIEQQLSRDITVTYITNLNRTQQQIVRLQWDFSRDFSVLAVRDENGVFGIDFLWRKRFK